MAIEGIDGSGKSTVVRLVARRLRAQGGKVWVTQEPTKTWLGRAVRRGIRSGLDPLAMAFLFLSDRALHADQIRARPRGEIVLTDRYRDSTTAYQAAALARTMPDALRFFASLQDRRFPRPDVAVLLDIPVEVGLARIGGRRVKEPFEQRAFLRRVRENYLALARQGRLTVLDAAGPPGPVADRIVEVIAASATRRGALNTKSR